MPQNFEFNYCFIMYGDKRYGLVIQNIDVTFYLKLHIFYFYFSTEAKTIIFSERFLNKFQAGPKIHDHRI